MPSGGKWHEYIFILCYTHLNLKLLLHKTMLLNFSIGTTAAASAASVALLITFFNLQLMFHTLIILGITDSTAPLWLDPFQFDL